MATVTSISSEGRVRSMTNGDKIRNMTDEELAEFIEPIFFDCSDYCSEFDNGCAFNCKHNRGEDFFIRVATVRSGVTSCQQVTNERKCTENTRVRLVLTSYKQVRIGGIA